MAKRLTRNTTSHQLFGSPADLPPNQLPTIEDVLRLILKHKVEDETASAVKFANINVAVNKAVAYVTAFWEKAIGDRTKCPLLSDKVIFTRIKRFYESGLEITRKVFKEETVQKFKEKIKPLFDICACSCPPISCKDARCNLKKCEGFHLDCKCDIRVPQREVRFLLDQRQDRKMRIEGIDLAVTRMWGRSELRERIEAEKADKE